MELKQLFKLCQKKDKKAQFEFFNKFSGKFLGIIVRYVGNKQKSEEILVECFLRIFSNFHNLNYSKNFEDKITKIVISIVIDYLDIKKIDYICKESDVKPSSIHFKNLQNLSKEVFINVNNKIELPQRVIFNMYAIDGYSHKEISNILGVSELVSKQCYLEVEKKIINLINDYEKK